MGQCASQLEAPVQGHSDNTAAATTRACSSDVASSECRVRKVVPKSHSSKYGSAQPHTGRLPSSSPYSDVLPEDVLAGMVASLPLPQLVRLSASSRQMQHVVQSSAHLALERVDLKQVPPEHVAAAMQWLLTQPSLVSVRDASLPLNAPTSPQLLSKLTSTHSLNLFEATRSMLSAFGSSPGAEPALSSLPLAQLTALTSLTVSVPYGALDKGELLPLPSGLLQLSVCASGFGAAINHLDLAALHSLSRLELSVTDSHASRSLAKLTALQSLRHLVVGRCWSMPPELPLPRLDWMEVRLYGKVPHGATGNGLERPLSAAATGMHCVPGRPVLQVVASVAVLAHCDGLMSDWAVLTNLRELRIDNIYPWGTGVFDVSALTPLQRLLRLHLGFEAQDQIQGVRKALHLRGLDYLVALKELALHSSGPELELMFEAPAHPMASLIVVAEGPLVMQTPGTAAAERAAAQPAHLMRTSLDSPALAVASPRSSFSGDAAGGLQGGPCNGVDVAAALANVGSRSGSATCSIGRRLTMSSIGEGDVEEDCSNEVSQLSHFAHIALLSRCGEPLVADRSLSRQLQRQAAQPTAAGASVDAAVLANRHVPLPSPLSRALKSSTSSFKAGRGSSVVGGSVMPLSSWLTYQGLTLEQLRLKQHTLVPPDGCGKQRDKQCDRQDRWIMVVREGADARALETITGWGCITLC